MTSVFPFSSDLKAVAIWAVKGCVTKDSHKEERSHKDAVCLCTSHEGMNGWGPKKPLLAPTCCLPGSLCLIKSLTNSCR